MWSDLSREQGAALTFPALLDHLRLWFGSVMAEADAYAELKRIQQQPGETVAGYETKFRHLFTKPGLRDQSEAFQVTAFRSGLRLELQRELIHDEFASVRSLAEAASKVERVVRRHAPPAQGAQGARWRRFAARLSAIAGVEDLGAEEGEGDGGAWEEDNEAVEALLAALSGGRGGRGRGRGRGRGGPGRGGQGRGKPDGGQGRGDTDGGPPGQPGKPVKEQGGFRGTDGRLILRVTCWECNEKGHFGDKCPFAGAVAGNQ